MTVQPRFWKKLAILAATEAPYGADAAPTATANAIQANNVSITPLEADEVKRDLMLPYLGNQGSIFGGLRSRVQFSVEIAGAGTAGGFPKYSPLLRGCGFAGVATAGVSVAYSPVPAAFASLTIYWNHDGVQHALTGARGTVSLAFTAKQIPYYKFDFTGLYNPPVDVALPAVTLTNFQTPVLCSTANTTVTLGGQVMITESLTLDIGQQIEPRFLIGVDSIENVDRSGAQARTMTAHNWFNDVVAGTEVALAVQHGTVAGNIVQIACPSVQLGKPGQGQTQNIINYSLPLMLTPQVGNDELIITVM
jgi:Phage tail tube protein